MPDRRCPNLPGAGRTSLPLLPWLVLLVLLVAGCGPPPPGKASYERQMAQVGRPADEALGQLEREQGQDPPSPEEVRTVADALDEAADDVESIRPPDEVREAHADLLEGLESLSTALSSLASDLEDAADETARMNAWLAFGKSAPAREAFAQIGDARAAYRAAGYRVLGERD